MAKKIVTIYIDDADLRLMVIKGKQIKEWAELALEPNLIKNNVILDEAEVAVRIKQIMKIQKIKTRKILVGISGLHCLSRPLTVPKLPKSMLTEAIRREAKRILPVPTDQLYLSWQILPSPEDKTNAFLVGIPQKTVDSLIKVLHQARLKPALLDMKPMLLARVVKKSTAIIVDVQNADFDIIILSEGVPQPIRTVALPAEMVSWQEKMQLITGELDRTIKFFDTNNPDTPLDKSVPIFVSGELAEETKLYQTLSKDIGHPVSELASPLDYPNGFQKNRFMANIGLALRVLPTAGEFVPMVVNLNSLPTQYRPPIWPLKKVLVYAGAAAAAAALAVTIFVVRSTPAETPAQVAAFNATNELIKKGLSEYQTLKTDVTALEKQVNDVSSSLSKFTKLFNTFEQQRAASSQYVESAVKSLPNTITLSDINYANNVLTINGRAATESDVLLYLKKLNESNKFGEITISNMSRSKDNGIEFTLVLGRGGQM